SVAVSKNTEEVGSLDQARKLPPGTVADGAVSGKTACDSDWRVLCDREVVTGIAGGSVVVDDTDLAPVEEIVRAKTSRRCDLNRRRLCQATHEEQHNRHRD